MSSSASARVLLGNVIDYAGTFPPAGLTLAAAISNYARDRASADAWMHGRLIVPASGLREFEQLALDVAGDVAQDFGTLRPAVQWPLSVVLGPQRGSLDEVTAFLRDSINHKDLRVGRIASVEFAPLRAEEIRAMKGQLPEDIEVFFETPLDADLDKRIDAIADARAMAKIRTGGLMAGAFPGAEGLVRFITACDDAGLAFKATAGLHHAVRGSYPLTYEPGSPTATMHGFLNLAVAAALVHVGADPSEAADALAESSGHAFQFGDSGLTWRDRTMLVDDLAAARQFFRSFGSCAFREPVQELTALGLV